MAQDRLQIRFDCFAAEEDRYRKTFRVDTDEKVLDDFLVAHLLLV